MYLIAQEKKAENLDRVEELLLRVKALYPSDSSPNGPLASLAMIYSQKEEWEKEEEAWEEVAELEADAQDVYWRLIELAEHEKDWKTIVKNARRLLAVDPTEPAPHRYLAKAADELGLHEESAEEYRALLAFDPVDLASAYFDLAEQLAKAGHSDEARREVLKALEEAPRYRDAHQLLLSLVRPSQPDDVNQTSATENLGASP